MITGITWTYNEQAGSNPKVRFADNPLITQNRVSESQEEVGACKGSSLFLPTSLVVQQRT
jgi:hypothetical protein